jgi:hypothetical protein
VHHDLVLVHGFSQRKSVLLLYSWCLMLSGLAVAMQRGDKVATVVLGIAAAVATVYMAQLLSRYRSRRHGLPDPSRPDVPREDDAPSPPEGGAGGAR